MTPGFITRASHALRVRTPAPMRGLLLAGLVVAAFLPAGSARAKSEAPKKTAAKAAAPVAVDARLFKDLAWRSIGPANMGGRISDVVAVEKRPATVFIAAGTGGAFKSANMGTTWTPIFEHEAVASVGAIALWQKNPEVVWIGTGEGNGRNSSSWGNGVYRSTNGGGKWEHVGLEATQNICRMVTDPGDSNTVYVAALGKLWGENPERGVYKTTDGGKTWTQSLKVDAKTGACDIVMDPSDARTLYAALYARKRTPWSFTSGGTTGGIFRSRDGGATWTKLTGGLPGQTGRIGLDIYRKNPKVLFAVVESGEGGRLSEFDSTSRAGGVFRSDDGGDTWKRLSAYTPRPFYFSKIRVQPDDDRRVYLASVDLWASDDGGVTFKGGFSRGIHPDFHAMWINPNDGDMIYTGTDGGIFVSHDRAKSWRFINNLALGEFYNIGVDMKEDYTICGGLQDNQNWCGPVRTRYETENWFGGPPPHEGILNANWLDLGGGDGFHVAIDPTNPNLVYFESQGADLYRRDLASGRDRRIRPSNNEGEKVFRFNWNSPFQLSPHDPSVLWLGGNHLFRLYDHAEKWEMISPDLTTDDPAKMATGGSAAEAHCTIVTLAESPVKAGVIWCGTDDGKVWVTPDGGKSWNDCTAALKGVPAGLYISRVEAGHQDAATAYVAIDGHRTDNFGSYLLATHDMGKSWRMITGDLPKDAPVKVIREDLSNPNLLFAGTEFGLHFTLDGGTKWLKSEGLPTVAVDDIVIHPRDRDLIAATHGRSIWVMDDITGLEGMTTQALSDTASFFPPRPATAFVMQSLGSIAGVTTFAGKNPPQGAYLNYFLPREIEEGVKFAIADSAGHEVRKLDGGGKPGLHRVVWDLQPEQEGRLRRETYPNQVEFVPAGIYTVTLTAGNAQPIKQKLVVRVAPGVELPKD